MERFFRLSAQYAFAAAVIFVLQLIPVTGIFLMFLLGPFWIGVFVHVFMIHITIMAFAGQLLRLVLILPAIFYAAGVALGLSSDIAASRWQSQQQWLRIDKQVPADTRDLAFVEGMSNLSVPPNQLNIELSDQDSAFQPEKLGFELFLYGSKLHPGDLQLILQPDAHQCPSGAWTLMDHCFTTSPMEHPSSYVLIGGLGNGCPTTEDVTHFFWGTIIPVCNPIKLYVGDDAQAVGRLSGAIIQNAYISYFLQRAVGWSITLRAGSASGP